jgi:hypothetical protein
MLSQPQEDAGILNTKWHEEANFPFAWENSEPTLPFLQSEIIKLHVLLHLGIKQNENLSRKDNIT